MLLERSNTSQKHSWNVLTPPSNTVRTPQACIERTSDARRDRERETRSHALTVSSARQQDHLLAQNVAQNAQDHLLALK